MSDFLFACIFAEHSNRIVPFFIFLFIGKEKKMFSERIKNIKLKQPLIHNITNYVTVNDCANILLACGASPIMADDLNEVGEITALCGGLNINIGTLNERTIASMIRAGKRANELNHPILLDPVGVGASHLRTQTANQLMNEIQFSVIRGNISEIKTLALGSGTTKGVDADVADTVTEENLEAVIEFAKQFAKVRNCIVVITGAIDIVTNSDKAYVIRNGHSMMAKITGSGCMLSAMTTAYVTANPDNLLEATAASVCAMGVAGEIAVKNLAPYEGNSTYRHRLIDAIYSLDGETLESRANYEVR